MIALCPHIFNDDLYVIWVNYEMHFAWQAQYLVKFIGLYILSDILICKIN